MIKRMRIDNFKSLNNFEICLYPATFIIGANASGKSTMLNALLFLKYICTESTTAYLDKHQLTVSDICSKLSKKKTISFSVIFDFHSMEISWDIEFIANKTDNTLVLSYEKISDGNKTLLLYSYTTRTPAFSAQGEPLSQQKTHLTKSYRLNEFTGEQEKIVSGEYKQSHLGIIGKDSTREYSGLCLVKSFFDATESFDLLSPKDMRESARGNKISIGRYGENLAAFIKGLNTEEREELISTMRSIFPNISDVKSVVRGRPGWAYIEVEEKFTGQNVSVSSRNVSDGMIRLIAFFAMKYHKNHGGLTLLDEIENGINSEVMERLLRSFQENSAANQQQFIATTHNTVLLDYIDPGSILYLSRDNLGNTKVYNPFSRSPIREKLDFMYPGEIILNTPNNELDVLADGDWGNDC